MVSLWKKYKARTSTSSQSGVTASMTPEHRVPLTHHNVQIGCKYDFCERLENKLNCNDKKNTKLWT